MKQIGEKLKRDISSLKYELDMLLKTKSCQSTEVLNLSKRLDRLILEYHKIG